ncbi:hypothetical protein DFJ74DRAFT_643253 [Hyaloraphidium curvatum]|nr:hypothetical protein DFJ74DRAFT_643253 [Hyaloraphidium curvatum]
MPAARSFLLLALAALLLVSTPTSAMLEERAGVPTKDSSHVLFARSCAECAENSFCEFGYPDAPASHVACVTYTVSSPHSLYRRYEYTGSYVNCITSRTCCGAAGYVTGDAFLNAGNAAECKAACNADPQCKVYDFFEGSCSGYTKCNTYDGENLHTGAVFQAQDSSYCPTSAC